MCLSNLAHSIDPTRSIKLCMEASVLPKLFSRLQCKCLSLIATSLPSSSRTLFSLILCLGAHSWMSCLSLFRATCITPRFATSSMHLCPSLTRRSVSACSLHPQKARSNDLLDAAFRSYSQCFWKRYRWFVICIIICCFWDDIDMIDSHRQSAFM